jgi:hypothetical protein
MALVHKFLMDDSGTELFRRLASQERVRMRHAARGHGLAVQFARTDPRKYSFSVRAVKKWNKLPEEVRAAPSIAAKESVRNRNSMKRRHLRMRNLDSEKKIGEQTKKPKNACLY